MIISLQMKINCLKHGYNLQMKISCLNHGYNSTNETKLFKTWL